MCCSYFQRKRTIMAIQFTSAHSADKDHSVFSSIQRLQLNRVALDNNDSPSQVKPPCSPTASGTATPYLRSQYLPKMFFLASWAHRQRHSSVPFASKSCAKKKGYFTLTYIICQHGKHLISRRGTYLVLFDGVSAVLVQLLGEDGGRVVRCGACA